MSKDLLTRLLGGLLLLLLAGELILWHAFNY
jgi:hypothetical protein